LTPLASRTPIEAHCRREYEHYDYFMGEDSIEYNKVTFPSIRDSLTDPASRIEHMDRMGVDLECRAIFVSEYFYGAPGRAAAESARIQNDYLADVAAENPDRFVPLGSTVPLQDVDLAIAEMDRAVDDLGFNGLQIAGDVDGHNLDEPRFHPFWAAV